MDTFPLPPSGSGTTSPGSGVATMQGTDLASDFDTFLRLLTTQIRNQDPLNPTESTEYATQLATFSNVEQGVRTNELLEGLVARLSGGGLERLAGWIGMEVRTTGLAQVDGGPVAFEAALPSLADSAVLVATAPDGTEVGRMAIDPRAQRHELVPTGFDGTPLRPGAYGFHVEPRRGPDVLQPVQAARYVEVREALIEEGRTVLVGPGGERMREDEISGLRPGTP